MRAQKIFLFFLFLLVLNTVQAQYVSTPSFPNYEENGGSPYWGNTLKMQCYINGNNATFYVEKKDGTPFSSSGKMYLKVGTYESFGVDHDEADVYAGTSVVTLNDNFSLYPKSSYPKEFYARYEADMGGYVWVGPIIIDCITPNPSVNNVTPSFAVIGQPQTFTVNGQNLDSNTAWYIADFGSGTVTSSSSTTTKTFTTTANYDAGVKIGEIKDQSGGSVLHNFNVTVNYPTPPAPILTLQGAQNIDVNWSAVPALGNFRYRLYRSTSNVFNTNNQIFCADDVTSYPDMGNHLLPNTTYYYWIRYCNIGESCTDLTPSWCSSASPFASITTPSSACTYSDVSTQTPWANTAAEYLCNEGILDDDGAADPTTPLNRAELAKLLYFSIDLDANSFVTGTVHNYPSPFNDLQNTALWDYFYAKTLSYLEYDGDCVTPFDRNAFNFYRADGIARKYLVKAILETWDINVSNVSGTEPFTDVNTSTEAYEYILKAYQDGIINGDNNNGIAFRPNDDAIRAEAFVMLYNALQIYGVPNVTSSDFYEPGNYTPQNFSQASGGHSGNFNFYTKTSFAISSIGLPLHFGHTYNSYLGDLPKEFFKTQPLGNGWSHTYHTYLMTILGDSASDDRVVLMLPNGTLNVFKKIGATYIPETVGVYSTLQKVSATQYTLTTKNQVVYTFQKQGNPNIFGSELFGLVSIKDRNNNTVSLAYENAIAGNGTKRLKTVTGSAGRTLSLYYFTGTDRIQRVNDPIGRNIYYTYSLEANGDYALSTFTNAKGDDTFYNYGNTECDAHLLMNITLPKGNTIDNQYNNRKLTSTETNSSNVTTFSRNFSHNSSGTTVNTITNISNYGNINTTYNANAVPTSISTPSAPTNTLGYSTTHPTLPSSINANGTLTSYSYDGNGNATSMNLPEGVTHSFSYNSNNDIISYTDPRGKVYTYTYDLSGNLIESSTPRSTTTMVRNSEGLIDAVTNPSGITVNYGYDNYGNVTSINAPEGINTSAAYDNASRLLNSTNPNGQITTYTYDANDNVLSHQFSVNTSYTYDANDNLTSITNANNNTTTLGYDFNNDFHTSTSFVGDTDTYTYYDDGRLNTYTDPDGRLFNYSYDGQKRLTDISSPNDNISFGYDSKDRVTQVINDTGGTIQFTYDNLNRVTSTTDFWGNTVSYTYDAASNVTAIQYDAQRAVSYTYYNDNLLKDVTDWNGKKTSYTYRSDGRLITITYPNGTGCTYTYDNAGRNTGHSWMKGTTPIATYSRTFDGFGNITAETANEPLDPIFPIAHNLTYTYDNANRIQSRGNTNFNFNDNGTAISKTGTNYTFNDHEMLTAISGAFTGQYKYDGLNNRRESTLNGVTTRYVLDILGMSKVLMETNASGTVQNYYVYGHGLISRIKPPSGETHYYHYDYRGSTIAMTDENGDITHEYAYSPYGELWASNEANPNPFKYVGQYGVMHEDENTYYMRARYYDASIGRFLSEDPIWHTNLYNYADGNPINMIDSNGEAAQVAAVATSTWFGAFSGAVQSIDEIAQSAYHGGRGFYLIVATYRNEGADGDYSASYEAFALANSFNDEAYSNIASNTAAGFAVGVAGAAVPASLSGVPVVNGFVSNSAGSAVQIYIEDSLNGTETSTQEYLLQSTLSGLTGGVGDIYSGAGTVIFSNNSIINNPYFQNIISNATNSGLQNLLTE